MDVEHVSSAFDVRRNLVLSDSPFRFRFFSDEIQPNKPMATVFWFAMLCCSFVDYEAGEDGKHK